MQSFIIVSTQFLEFYKVLCSKEYFLIYVNNIATVGVRISYTLHMTVVIFSSRKAEMNLEMVNTYNILKIL